jgi:quinol monooxygenase YgiN
MTEGVGYGAYIRVRTKPEKRDEFLRLISKLRADVKQHESKTLFFEIFQGPDTNEFVLIEGYVDEAAQQQHQNAPYHVAMSDAGWACLEGQPVIEFMKPAV